MSSPVATLNIVGTAVPGRSYRLMSFTGTLSGALASSSAPPGWSLVHDADAQAIFLREDTALRIDAVMPSSGTVSGGTPVTVLGAGFLAGPDPVTAMSFGGIPATDLLVIDDATLACVTPAHPAGAADAIAASRSGTASLIRGYIYTDVTHNVLFLSAGNGRIQGSASQSVPAGGATTAVLAVPDANHHFTGWTGDHVGPENPLTLANVTRDMAVVANFARDTARLTMAVAGAGGVAPAIGDHTVNTSEAVPIAAAEALPGSFQGWLASGGAVIANANAASTHVTLSGDGAVTAVFSAYQVVFSTDGTAGASLTGELVQTVAHGADCTPVAAVAAPGYAFRGWIGDHVGAGNPLTVTHVVANMAIVASFRMEQVAQGAEFAIAAESVPGLPAEGRFMLRPKAYAAYGQHPVTGKPGKAGVKLLEKVAKGVGAETVPCEWTRRIRLYDPKALKASEAQGIGAAEWITATTMADLPMTLHVAGKEIPGGDAPVKPLALAVPVIDDIADDGLDAKDNQRLAITGRWFGTRRPKVWREFTVPGKAEGSVVVRRQAMKVLKPTAEDAEDGFRDRKGKPTHMRPMTGDSKIVVIVPKDPKGIPNDILVLDNGVGLAAFEHALGD